jgi:hypothetical protein
MSTSAPDPATRPETPSSAAAGVSADTRWVVHAPAPATVALVWLILALSGGVGADLEPIAAYFARLGEVILFTLALHALHEAGHVIGGLLVGVPFHRVTLALATLVREEAAVGSRLRLEWNRAWSKVAGCVERDLTPAPGLRVGLTVTALAGPLASFVGGALLTWCPAPWSHFGAVSIVVGMLNLVPVSYLGQASDGMVAWRLWSPAPAHVAWRAVLFPDEAQESAPAASEEATGPGGASLSAASDPPERSRGG